MANDFLIIVPTRSRSGNLDNLLNSWRVTTSGCSDVIVALDDDDDHNYSRYDDVQYYIGPRLRLGPTLNKVATQYIDIYKYIMFMGDDFIFRTQNWDNRMCQVLEQYGVGIVYGDDLHQGALLPTEVALTSNIIKTLGYMVPPGFVHMFLDNLWKDWGNAMSRLFYLPDIVIEHMHPMANKGMWDTLYDESSVMMGPDGERYNQYMQNGFAADVEKLIKLKESYV